MTFLKSAVMIMLSCAFVGGTITAQQPPKQTATSDNTLRNFLQGYLQGRDLDADKKPLYFAAFVNLGPNARNEVIVYLSQQAGCGTGGCGMLVLTLKAGSYRVIGNITIGWPPIRVLDHKTNGWHDLGVWVQGGGIQPGYEAQLQFNGKKYPNNPSAPPAHRVHRKPTGEVVVTKTDAGVPVYP